MSLKSILFYSVLIVCYSVYAGANLLQANWSPCKYENGTVIPTQSEDVEVYVTNCTRNQTECKFVRGTSAVLNITFKATSRSREIERGILAKMYMQALNKYVNIPYGSLINPCESMRSLNTTETTCLSTGIRNNNIYSSQSEFKVSTDFPEVRNIQVIIIFREKNSNRRVSSLRKWDKHPGPMYLCIVLDNCAVV